MNDSAPPLADLKVLDISTIFAGPHCARYLADFGADVVKVEQPSGDSSRNIGWRAADGETLWWKLANRGKRAITLDLKNHEDLATLKRMLSVADVLVENLRPGKLEALGLIPDELIETNPKLTITRVTGFGQSGPYRNRPGFATLAEAMSGFSAMSGEAGGAPLLPPIALTDEVTGLAAAFATMVAVHSGGGQTVDVNLLETMMQIMGPLISAWHTEGYLQPRLGSGIAYSVPRGTYQASDGGWIAVSTSSDVIAQRVMKLIGVAEDERFQTFDGRIANREEVDKLMADWVKKRTLSEALESFELAEAAAAPVLNVGELSSDRHVAERGALVEVDGIVMQSLIAQLSKTPGSVRWAGRSLGADNGDLPGPDAVWFRE
ncbi:MAG TPA: CoA transferase [Acidimicrobiaceae bacterium]|nr:CoA transferase [Acidimicrobiaceae bacterium]